MNGSGPEVLKRKVEKQKARIAKRLSKIPENLCTLSALEASMTNGRMLIVRWYKEIAALKLIAGHSDEYLLCKINRRNRDIVAMQKHLAKCRCWRTTLRKLLGLPDVDPSLDGPL